MLEAQGEEVLKPVCQEISYLVSGRIYRTVEEQFREVATARLHSATLLKTEEVLLPVYLGRRASKITVVNIPPELYVAWLVAVILLGMEVRMVVLQATRTLYRKWQGQNQDVVVNVDPEDIESMMETIAVCDVTLKIIMEGRIPQCFKCGLKDQIRLDCLL